MLDTVHQKRNGDSFSFSSLQAEKDATCVLLGTVSVVNIVN